MAEDKLQPKWTSELGSVNGPPPKPAADPIRIEAGHNGPNDYTVRNELVPPPPPPKKKS